MSKYLARLLSVAVFGASAIGHITNFKSDVNYLASNVAALSKAYGFAMPATEILEGAFGIAIALLVLGVVFLGLGINDYMGSFFLILFLLPVTPIMHAFWLLPAGMEKQVQLAMFLKNTSLLGLLLYVNIVNGYRTHRTNKTKTQ